MRDAWMHECTGYAVSATRAAQHAPPSDGDHGRRRQTQAGHRQGLSDSAQYARDGFAQLAREQPLALGAVGIALGALVGAVLPRTEPEERVLGRASEELREKGRRMARDAYESAADKAAEVAEVAGETLQRDTPTPYAGSNPVP